MIISKKIMEFILDIYNQGGKITRKTQVLFAYQYYAMTWHLRDNGIIKENGITKDGQKIWELTDKGVKVAEIFKELKKVLYGS
jgi:predicted transcriptional regulator